MAGYYSFMFLFFCAGDSTSSSSSGQSSMIEPGWNSLALNYTVQWPLHIFFTPNVLDKYVKFYFN